MKFVVLILVVGLLFFGLVWLLAHASQAVVGFRQKSKSDGSLAEEVKRRMIAERGLRAIANGAGNPVFEAQDALEQISNTYIKELN